MPKSHEVRTDSSESGHRARCSCGWHSPWGTLDAAEDSGHIHLVEVGEQEFLGYRLILNVVAPGFRDLIVLEDLDIGNLTPQIVSDTADRFWERYPGEDEHEFIEIRADYIVSRQLELKKHEHPPPPNPVDGLDEPPPRVVVSAGADLLEETRPWI